MGSTPRAEYAFRHPLIRAVAYESQLKSDAPSCTGAWPPRSNSVTRRGGRERGADRQPLEAAGDLHAAYGWHMRAGTWFNNRDIGAARTSWQRAQQVADRLADRRTGPPSMRIAPRTLMCGTAFRVGVDPAHTGFEELHDLAVAADDKVSLAIGMAGQLTTLAFHSHYREAVKMASELEVLIESIGDPTLTVALLYTAAQRSGRPAKPANADAWYSASSTSPTATPPEAT